MASTLKRGGIIGMEELKIRIISKPETRTKPNQLENSAIALGPRASPVLLFFAVDAASAVQIGRC
eukprot:scaffold7615_cov286-Pinguiococcus_pyrenoidosus.AAC.10